MYVLIALSRMGHSYDTDATTILRCYSALQYYSRRTPCTLFILKIAKMLTQFLHMPVILSAFVHLCQQGNCNPSSFIASPALFDHSTD